jgi:hypothetical protein
VSKTKTSMVPTFIVIAAIMVGVGYFGLQRGPVTDSKDPDDRMVGVYAVWEPSPYRDGVQVVVTVAGKAKVDKVETMAPFTRTYPARRGDKVSISVHFKSGLGTRNFQGVLGCSITANGHEETHDYNQKAAINQPLACSVILT